MQPQTRRWDPPREAGNPRAEELRLWRQTGLAILQAWGQVTVVS